MRVLVALSGGLDSAAAAITLKNQGCIVEAIYINMHGRAADVLAAQSVARSIDVPLTVVDAIDDFKNSVLQYFKTQLSAGRTPAPCSFCNPNLKWRILYDFACKNGFDRIATGHYVQTAIINDNVFIRKGTDATKDQSYYLWDLPQVILHKTLFPLGAMTKIDVRKMLGEMGFSQLSIASESMSLCFINKGVDYADFVRSVINCSSGDVVDGNDNVIGAHDGVELYTVGQKRGFECNVDGARVVALDVQNNRVVVSEKGEDLYSAKFELIDWRVEDYSLLCGDDIYLKVRGLGRNPSGPFAVEQVDDVLEVQLLDDKAWAMAKGQPVVFYKGEILTGGGYMR